MTISFIVLMTLDTECCVMVWDITPNVLLSVKMPIIEF